MFRRWGDGIGIPDAMYLSQADCADLMIGGSTLIRRRYGDTVALAGAEGTSDFPAILLDAINKNLRQAYLDVPIKWPAFCKKNTARDFKNIYSIAMSEFPDLLEENEAAETKDAQLSDGKETYSLAAFRRQGLDHLEGVHQRRPSGVQPHPAAHGDRRAPEGGRRCLRARSWRTRRWPTASRSSPPRTTTWSAARATSASRPWPRIGACETLLLRQKGPAGTARLELTARNHPDAGRPEGHHRAGHPQHVGPGGRGVPAHEPLREQARPLLQQPSG